jgi:3'-phosphoadenosine 5'-phosphosulfate (PAPS) 3'-phosphatase
MINGINFNGSLPYVQKGERVYVHSRVLGALAGLQVEWDSKAGQVVLKGDHIRLAYDAKSPIVYQEKGMTYIDLDAYAEQMKQFQWSYIDNQLTMSVIE